MAKLTILAKSGGNGQKCQNGHAKICMRIVRNLRILTFLRAKNYMSDSIRRNEQRKKMHGTNGTIGTMKPESAKSVKSARANF